MQPVLLMAVVVASYLLLAGSPPWTLAPLWSLIVLAAVVAARRTFSFPAAYRKLDLALVAVVGAMAIQLIPLPPAVINLLSPNAARLRAETQLRLAAPSGWMPLSIDPADTLEAIAIVGMPIVVFWIARAVFSAGGFTRQFCRLLGWFSAAAAVVAIVQRAVSPGLVMGMVTPVSRNANPIGPFLNRNHFAAWLLMASAASIGYLLAHLQIHPAYRHRFRQAIRHFMTSGAMLSAVCAVTTLTVMVLTLSRSVVAGFGAAALAGGWLGRSRLRIERNRFPAVLTGAGVLLLAAAATLDIEGWYTRFQETMVASAEFDRVTIWRESMKLIADFPVAGTGAGTYGLAMPQYQQSRIWVGAMQAWAYFNNAHSHYVQLIAEGGLLLGFPVAAAVLVAVKQAIATIRADKGEQFWIRIGAAAGMVGIAVQSIWEVSLLLPANAILFATLAGLVLYRRDASRVSATRDLAA